MHMKDGLTTTWRQKAPGTEGPNDSVITAEVPINKHDFTSISDSLFFLYFFLCCHMTSAYDNGEALLLIGTTFPS